MQKVSHCISRLTQAYVVAGAAVVLRSKDHAEVGAAALPTRSYDGIGVTAAGEARRRGKGRARAADGQQKEESRDERSKRVHDLFDLICLKWEDEAKSEVLPTWYDQ